MAGASRDPIIVSEDDDVSDSSSQGSSGLGSQSAHQSAVQALQETSLPATVQIDESSDVQIGSRLNYNAPVTVNQYVVVSRNDGREAETLAIGVPRFANTSISGIHQGNAENNEEVHNCIHSTRESYTTSITPSLTSRSCSRTQIVRPVLWSLLAGVAIVGAAVAIVFAIIRPQGDNPEPDTRPNTTTVMPDMTPNELPGGHHIYPRDIWGNLEVSKDELLLHPTPVVVISQTGSRLKCADFSDCSQKLKTSNMLGTRRIYNFLVGGDGNIYQEKGWDAQAQFERSEGILGICFVGDFDKHTLTASEIEATTALLNLGVKMRKLAPNFKLIGQNQVKKSFPLGKHILQVISKWPNWTPELTLS